MAELMFVSGPSGTSGGGDEIIDLPFNSSASGNTLTAGYVYLNEGELKASSRALVEAFNVGFDSSFNVRLRRQNNGTVVATWVPNFLISGFNDLILGVSAPVQAGWHYVTVTASGMNNQTNTSARLHGVHLELTPT
jgi:hypothetical protein